MTIFSLAKLVKYGVLNVDEFPQSVWPPGQRLCLGRLLRGVSLRSAGAEGCAAGAACSPQELPSSRGLVGETRDSDFAQAFLHHLKNKSWLLFAKGRICTRDVATDRCGVLQPGQALTGEWSVFPLTSCLEAVEARLRCWQM